MKESSSAKEILVGITGDVEMQVLRSKLIFVLLCAKIENCPGFLNP